MPYKMGELKFYIVNVTHKQYSLSDTIFNHILSFGPPGKQVKVIQKNLLNVGRRRRHVVGFEDLSIDVFLEVRNKRYS